MFTVPLLYAITTMLTYREYPQIARNNKKEKKKLVISFYAIVQHMKLFPFHILIQPTHTTYILMVSLYIRNIY